MTVPSVRRALATVAVVLTAGALAACTEKLDSGAACPSLCPGQDVPVQDTILDAVAIDTSLTGFPAKGEESFLLLADRGADLQASAVIRFDTLTTKAVVTAGDTAVAITAVYGSKVRLIVDSTGSTITAPVTVRVYDVDTTAPDADDAAVLALFTPSREIGATTFAVADAKDTLEVSLSDSAVLSKIVGKRRLRLGFRVASAEPVQLKIFSTSGGASGPLLSYDPTPTTDTIKAVTVLASSETPASLPTIASSLRDYTIVTSGPRPLASDAMAVGGLPARRSYIGFDVPLRLLDSVTVVRATLLLTQRPVANVEPTTAVSVIPSVVLAGTDVTDIARASNIIAADSAFNVTTIAITPGGSGVREVELGTLLRNWRTVVGRQPTQHALVLRAAGEGVSPGEVWFYSSEAADEAVRPRLRVTYVPRVDFGVP